MFLLKNTQYSSTILIFAAIVVAAIVAYHAESMNSKLKNVSSTCFTLSDRLEHLSSGKIFTLTDAGGDSLIPRDRIIVMAATLTISTGTGQPSFTA